MSVGQLADLTGRFIALQRGTRGATLRDRQLAVSDELPAALLNEIAAVASKIKVAAADRNKVIHGGFPLGGGVLHVRDAVTQLSALDPPSRRSLVEIDATADKCVDLADRAGQLVLRIVQGKGRHEG